MAKYIKTHFSISEECVTILEEVMKSDKLITNKSQALRYLLQKNYQEFQKASPQESKNDAIVKKELSDLRVMVASIGESLQTPVTDNEHSEFYKKSTEVVSQQIKRNITKKRDTEFYS